MLALIDLISAWLLRIAIVVMAFALAVTGYRRVGDPDFLSPVPTLGATSEATPGRGVGRDDLARAPAPAEEQTRTPGPALTPESAQPPARPALDGTPTPRAPNGTSTPLGTGQSPPGPPATAARRSMAAPPTTEAPPVRDVSLPTATPPPDVTVNSGGPSATVEPACTPTVGPMPAPAQVPPLARRTRLRIPEWACAARP